MFKRSPSASAFMLPTGVNGGFKMDWDKNQAEEAAEATEATETAANLEADEAKQELARVQSRRPPL
jgi:hypothetical protein